MRLSKDLLRFQAEILEVPAVLRCDCETRRDEAPKELENWRKAVGFLLLFVFCCLFLFVCLFVVVSFLIFVVSYFSEKKWGGLW